MTRFLENSNNFDIENVLEETTDNWFDGIIIYKIIEIKDNEIVSISNKYMIKFKLNKKNKYLLEGDFQRPNILKINENEFATSYIDAIHFWDYSNYCTEIKKIENCSKFKSINYKCLLNDDLFYVGGKWYEI